MIGRDLVSAKELCRLIRANVYDSGQSKDSALSVRQVSSRDSAIRQLSIEYDIPPVGWRLKVQAGIFQTNSSQSDPILAFVTREHDAGRTTNAALCTYEADV